MVVLAQLAKLPKKISKKWFQDSKPILDSSSGGFFKNK